MLYGTSSPSVPACPPSLPPDARIRCLYDDRLKADPKAASLAYEMLVKWKILVGTERAQTMDGGYRGILKLEPALPTGDYRKHLEWIAAAFRDFEQFFSELDTYAAAHPPPTPSTTKRYRWRPITLLFMKSINGHRPSAYAHAWTVAYNFEGSLNLNADAVRETFFHEMFHLNDFAHHTWSPGPLSPSFEFAVKKCGTSIPCLGPYTPNETIVRGGTYYAFQPGNGGGVLEYGAELALRYYREQRAALRNLTPKPKPFKCGPPENARSWEAMKTEFFGGIDAVPACS